MSQSLKTGVLGAASSAFLKTITLGINVRNALLLVGAILSNILMWTNFIKLNKEHTSTACNVSLVNGYNLLFSALFGWVFFGETISKQWLFGASIVLMGLYLIQSDEDAQIQNTKLNDQKVK